MEIRHEHPRESASIGFHPRPTNRRPETSAPGPFQSFRRHQLPGFANEARQLIVADRVQLDANPALHTDIRRTKKGPRRGVDQRRLHPWRGGYPHCHVAVVVMIVGEHGKDFLADEESWFAV